MKPGMTYLPQMIAQLKEKRYCRPLLAAMAIACLAGATSANADAPPFNNKNIELVGRGQKVDAFLKDLYGQAGLKVRVSSAVTGNIQGTFTGTPQEIWKQASKAFNLVAYYDGAIVSVYAANEIQTRTLSSESPAAVVAEAKKLRLVDANNTVTAGSSNIVASGVPAFIQRIEAIASNRVIVKPVAEPVTPVIAAAPRASTTDVISPVAGKPSSAPGVLASTGSMVRSTVRSKATARFPYEIRVFYLRYAEAQDTIRNSGGSQMIVPGVASVLRGIMGDGRPSETVTSGGNYELNKRAMSQGVGEPVSRADRVADFGDGYEEEYGDQPRRRERGSGGGDVNGPRIEVDVANKAVIVRDRPEAMATYESLIASLDIEPTSVELEVTIIELNMTRAKELGLDFGFSTGGVSAVFGGTLTPTTAAPSGSFSASYLTGAGSLFTARLTALERSGTARVVTKPRVITVNNLQAEFGSETEVFVPITAERVADLRAVRAGLVLRVTPSILYDGGELRTRLEVYIQDGSVVRDADGTPVVQRSQLNTNAVVKQGEAVLIGGMTVSSQFDDKSKTPVLGDIPVVGNAFKKRRKSSARVERLFLITPRVLSQGSQDETSMMQTPAAQTPIPIEVLEGKRKKGSDKGRTYR
jgi:type III secretion protein C